MLDALPATMPASGWLTFLPDYARLFESQLYAINAQVGLKEVEIEFAVAGLSDVCQALAYALLVGKYTPPPPPPPASEEGESNADSPHRLVRSLPVGRGGVRGGVNSIDRNIKTPVPWQTPREIYDSLKPLARQMRKIPTPAEANLWEQVRDKRILGYKFRRQHTIDRFIVDFHCPDANLIIEVDGPIHDYSQEEDTLRQAYLESLNLTVLRFTNDEVLQNTVNVVNQIRKFLKEWEREEEESRIDSPHRLRGGVRGGVNDPANDFFHPVYNQWLDNSLKVFTQTYPYPHAEENWQVQIFAHAYGRAGLVVHRPDATDYVYDPALGCPAEGFMAALLGEIAARMLAATAA